MEGLTKVQSRVAIRGYTLMEVLITVAIIGILAAIAIPSYQRSVMRGYRSVAQGGLLDLANRQEQYYLNNKSYTTSLANLGYTNVFTSGTLSTVALNSGQTVVPAGSAGIIYHLSIVSASASAFTLTAVPQNSQAADAECASFGLNNTGTRTVSGSATVADCW